MDVFDLQARIGLDKSEYDAGVKDAKGTMSDLAKNIGNGLKTVAKAGAAAIAAGAAGVAALTKMSVEGYAQYEQLVGGVETLFKTSQNVVVAYAENAYKTSGMSANTYMETVTSFSASLIQSLGGDTAKAAEIGDMAITDMADNANKMGTSLEMLQTTYAGFSKQNFTMLDNLKLGYGGTKEEMQRLLKDAEKISGVKYDISSFADITQAIHVMQEEMGIAGATAAEAATTIEGSLGMMKGAWQNLVVGMADENADIGGLINNLVESAASFAENIIPRIEQALQGVGRLVEGLAPIIGSALPGLVSSVLPALLSAAVELLNSVVSALPGLISTLTNSIIPSLLSGLESVIGALISALPMVISSICSALPTLLPMLLSSVISLVVLLCSELPNIIQPIISMLPTLLTSVVSALLSNLPILIEGIITLVLALVGMLPDLVIPLLQMLPEIVVMVVNTLLSAAPTLFSALGQLVFSCLDVIWSLVEALPGALENFILTLFSQMSGWVSTGWEAICTIVNTAIELVKSTFSRGWEYVKNLTSNLWAAIQNVFVPVAEWFSANVIQPVGNFFKNMWSGLKSGASDAWAGIKSVFSNITSWFRDKFTQAWTAVKNVFSTGGKVFDGIKEGIVSVFTTVVNAIIGGINKVISVPFNALNNILQRIRNIEIVGLRPFDWVTTFNVPQIPKLSTGLNYVPYDEYPAFLHRGEAVLTAAQARAWRNGQGGAMGNNGQILSVLVSILNAINGGNEDLVHAVMADKSFSVSGREFGRLVREYA